MGTDLESIPDPEGLDDDLESLRGGYQPTLDDVAEDNAERDVFRGVSHTVSGPMPSANELAGYKAVEAELPMLIYGMAKEEQSHRHDMERHEQAIRHQLEKTDMSLNAAATKRGQLLGGCRSLGSSSSVWACGGTWIPDVGRHYGWYRRGGTCCSLRRN